MARVIKILMIDDEPDICRLIKASLEATGRFEVKFALEPKEGIEQAKACRPHLILLDIVMPRMSGAEVASCLLRDDATKDIPVAFLTALVEEREAQKALGLIGEHFFISKAVSTKELIEQIEYVLERGRQ